MRPRERWRRQKHQRLPGSCLQGRQRKPAKWSLAVATDCLQRRHCVHPPLEIWCTCCVHGSLDEAARKLIFKFSLCSYNVYKPSGRLLMLWENTYVYECCTSSYKQSSDFAILTIKCDVVGKGGTVESTILLRAQYCWVMYELRIFCPVGIEELNLMV